MKEFALICSLVSLVFPIAMLMSEYLFRVRTMHLGSLWLVLGYHLLLIPLCIILTTLSLMRQKGNEYLLPLVTWASISLTVALFRILGLFGVQHNSHDASLTASLLLFGSIFLVLFVYRKISAHHPAVADQIEGMGNVVS